jgi:hypothetical protein
MSGECDKCGEHTLECICYEEELVMREEAMALMAGMTKAMIFELLKTNLSDKELIANVILYLEDFINAHPEYVNDFFSDRERKG